MPMQDRPPPPAPGRERTKGWGVIGLALIALGFVCYILFAIGIVAMGLNEEADIVDVPWQMMIISGLSVVSFVAGAGILIVKVLLDRILNREDDYYSKNIER